MKKIYFLLFAFFCFSSNAQIVNIPDPDFKARLLAADFNNSTASMQSPDQDGYVTTYNKIDTNNDGQIQVSEAALIKYLNIYPGLTQGPITNLTGIGSFINLRSFNCVNQQIAILDTSSLINLTHLKCEENNITSLNVSMAPNLIYLSCYGNNLVTLNVAGLSNLKYLRCSDNQITTLNLTNSTSLELLFAENNNLTSLNLSNLPNLTLASLSYNMLTTLTTYNLPSLTNLDCSANQLTSLDVSTLPALLGLGAGGNQLTSVNFGSISSLTSLDVINNQLVSLDLSEFFNLSSLECGLNYLTSLDVSNANNMTYLRCSYNQLTSLFIKRGIGFWPSGPGQDYNFVIDNNENLVYVCANEADIPLVMSKLGNLLNPCNVNSYCDFGYGGIDYTIQGNTKMDANVNGCDSADGIYPNLKFAITNGSIDSDFVSDNSGAFSIPVQEGTYTITPQIENASYYNISPLNATFTFPTQNGTSLQSFCAVPNGNHNDLEVIVVPNLPARPGFDATYKIIYKNKGTTTLSGSVTFQFEDAKMDLVSSTPLFSSQATGLLTYNYTNLQPFETREITITININTPQENPAVNLGDQLNFTAIINPLSGDEYLPDNTSSLKQIVVGSYDPNDKTCVEGNEVGPESIGQYVHYVIRFENTGTFPAENIVVKDMIDLTKFDLSTLIPISSSHSFITRIAADGKVEFIFESIQLPFDDANNDGYVAFKIKTLPSLAVGNTFSNKANIYFDYNFPIETNTAITSIQALGNSDFNLDEYITLYPNPVKNELNIKVNNEISISSVNIYNALGQLVLVATNPSESIDVSGLKTGCYFVKVISDKGTSNGQIIKE